MTERSDSLILGIDLGGTKILTALVDSRGELLARVHNVTPAAGGPDAVIQSILESVDRTLSEAKINASEVEAIGLGAPGPSNPKTGILYASPNLPGWKNVAIRQIVEDEFHRKTFLINDANAAAFAEFRFGAARGVQDFIYLTISTGIGSGIIIGGNLYTGSIGTAGELGHMTIDDDGPRCNCGNIGCWETLASGTSLARYAREAIHSGVPTSILDLVEGDAEKVTALVVQRAAEQGDEAARGLIARTAYYLGVGLTNVINIFNPEMIVFGGGLSNMGDMLFEPALKTAGERAYRNAFESVRFVRAELGRNSGVIGAAAYAREQLQKKTTPV